MRILPHLKELMREHDERVARLLLTQLTDENDPRRGGYMTKDYHIDARACGFSLSSLIIAYVCRESRYYLNEDVKRAVQMNLDYMRAHQREDGCVDLTACNFASAPDTAFMANALMNAFWLLDDRDAPDTAWLRAPLLAFLERCAEGVKNGGFHTPNHRWAIAACLKAVSHITGRGDFSTRADEYLNEGLDINADGEFAERSAGNYNQVNDDQMIRLYLATKDARFLTAARDNLRMMLNYIEPDDSVFTNNSTRQDYGKKVYLDSYYILFLLVGRLLDDKQLAAYAEYCYQSSRAHGCRPAGVEWLLLMPALDGYGEDASVDRAAFTRYDRLFRESKIARMRRGGYSCTLMQDRPNFLYFQHGAFTMYMVIYANLCDKRNFTADTMEKTEGGYALSGHAAGWYYLPFYPDKPETSDWWAMDNKNTRKRMQGLPLDTFVSVDFAGDGVDVRLRTEGIDQLPLRVEIGFRAGCAVRHKDFLLEGKAGGRMFVLGGDLEVTGADGDVITLSGCFGEHANLARSDGAYPESGEHFTVYLTAYTPVDKLLHIGTTPFAKKDLLPQTSPNL